MNSGVVEFLVIFGLGLAICIASYITLSDQAAVFFGFIYVIVTPLVHELFEYGYSGLPESTS